MSEPQFEDVDGTPRPEPTGVETVDQVVADVAELDRRPLAEHVAVFEQAHDELRRALDATPTGP